MLKRKIYNKLIDWKNKQNKKALLVRGPRQVGKTYIIREFGNNEYESFIEMNLITNSDFIHIFDDSLNPKDIYRGIISRVPNAKLIENKTLIFFDEIQVCPKARTALKFLVEDGKYDFISSGSLLGINYKDTNQTSIPVGFEKDIEMNSLDFEEFLWANGIQKESIDFLKEFYDNKKIVPDDINNRYLKLIDDYIVVGGMPSVVNEYIINNNFIDANEEQNEILKNYKDDILHYSTNVLKQKINKCFDSIPLQLSKENKKFQYSKIETGANKTKYESSLNWLIDAGFVKKCNNVSIPEFPINAYFVENDFKIYLNDLGLLTAIYGLELQKSIIRKDLKGHTKGGIYENLVFDMLTKNGITPYYYKNKESTQEIEFLYDKDGDIVPIEVKSKNGQTVSLNEYIKKYKPHLAYKFIYGNVGFDGVKYTLPYYMGMFVK